MELLCADVGALHLARSVQSVLDELQSLLLDDSLAVLCGQVNKLTLDPRLKLKTFQKFDSAATALEEVAALVEGKVTPTLAALLNDIKDEKHVSLAVADEKLGMPSIGCVHNRSLADRR